MNGHTLHQDGVVDTILGVKGLDDVHNLRLCHKDGARRFEGGITHERH
ncbi:MAG: hypothetical protein UY48_C0049G0004 [Candidatus Gottesmanbacteria bacterium GW2011_GWB1_49_7]|uniref:Uncharacterized protein n=1 Tax=Candidatus Gottesmanbacteria bacterium GW2011_GWB1_49_7 TaxID=1618448 RepID=A0A0G1VU91_9BACT|nr:MAG: hypothetical protein UY48_C0049G0004 [Candidatus Gottesmanbacteria bacterium GW2011_GWB1_49_7]